MYFHFPLINLQLKSISKCSPTLPCHPWPTTALCVSHTYLNDLLNLWTLTLFDCCPASRWNLYKAWDTQTVSWLVITLKSTILRFMLCLEKEDEIFSWNKEQAQFIREERKFSAEIQKWERFDHKHMETWLWISFRSDLQIDNNSGHCSWSRYGIARNNILKYPLSISYQSKWLKQIENTYLSSSLCHLAFLHFSDAAYVNHIGTEVKFSDS